MSSKALRFAPCMLSLPAALLSALVICSPFHAALAQQTVTSGTTASLHIYNLDAGPLAQTLDAIAAINGRKIAYERSNLKGVSAHAVRGNYSLGAAVSEALATSGFGLSEDEKGNLVISRETIVTITAQRDQAETSFKADRSDTATRSGSYLHVVPASVTLLTSKLLESQQVTNLQDSLRNVSGITFSQSPQGTPTFSIRGFTASATSNGVTDSHSTGTDVFGVERVEVLKGPQAILSGGDSMGGTVNVVLKKPQAEVIRDVTVQYGTGGDKTFAVDVSGSITDDKRLTYRVIGDVAKARRSEGGYDGRQMKSLMPELRWKDKTTDLIVGASYSDSHAAMSKYTFARRDGVILPAPNMLLSNPADGFDSTDKRIFYQLEQQFGSSIVLVSRMQRAKEYSDLHVYSPGGLNYAKDAAPNAPDANMDFYNSRTQSNDQTVSGDHYLRFTGNTWSIRHKLSVGFNHVNYNLNQYETSGPGFTATVFPATPVLFEDTRTRSVEPSSTTQVGQLQKAIYVQDLLSFGDWNLLLNGRRNQYTLKPSSTNFIQYNFIYNSPKHRIYSTTPGAGIIYKLTEDTSIYASYSEGFIPSVAINCSGGLVAPSETKNKELGAKFDLRDSKFTLTASIFSLRESNRLVYFRPGNCYNVRDAQENRGLEIDGQGELAKNLDAVFNYTYNTVKDVGNSTATFAGQPRHKMSLWAVYHFPIASLKGFGAGIGISASSKNLGTYNASRPFYLPGQAQLDASLMYDLAPWNVIFGVKNLSNRILYDTASTDSFLPIRPARQFMLTAKRSFK